MSASLFQRHIILFQTGDKLWFHQISQQVKNFTNAGCADDQIVIQLVGVLGDERVDAVVDAEKVVRLRMQVIVVQNCFCVLLFVNGFADTEFVGYYDCVLRSSTYWLSHNGLFAVTWIYSGVLQ